MTSDIQKLAKKLERLRRTKRQFYARHREDLLIKHANWRRQNRERYRSWNRKYVNNLSAEKKLARSYDSSYRSAIRNGSVAVDYDKLLGLIGESILPDLADGVYEWETLETFPTKKPIINHKLTFKDGEAEWEITSQGVIAMRGNNLHLIRGYENKMSVSCLSGKEFGDQLDILPNYFIHLIQLSIG